MFDVAIVGAGVIGSSVAREISRYKLDVCVIEKEEDVCCGTSKANSAIIHGGYDAVPGTVKAGMNVLGNAMMDRISKELDIPFKRNGSIVVCTKDQDPAKLKVLMDRGIANGVQGLRILNREELIAMEPNLADDVVCGLWAPTGGIVCPFDMTMGYAENACENGVKFFLNTKVENIEKTAEGFRIGVCSTDCCRGYNGIIETRLLINAAGVYADEINNMLSSRKLHITARKGEYMLLDKKAGSHLKSTVFQLPSAMGKGVLVSPTIHGNLIVGPTALNIPDKEAVNTTSEGLEKVKSCCSLSVKNVPLRQVITSFAGLRAHEEGDDFIIGPAPDVPGLINVAGIESPGLSSAPAIAVTVADMVKNILHPEEKTDFNPIRHGVLRPGNMTLEERNALIKKNPAYGNIICRCEMISEGEITDAIKRPLGARSLDGIKRRTRAGMGRCQSGFCSPRVMEILSRELGMPMEEIGKNGSGSRIIESRR